MNALLSYQNLLDNCSMLVPMSTGTKLWRSTGSTQEFPYVKYNVSRASQMFIFAIRYFVLCHSRGLFSPSLFFFGEYFRIGQLVQWLQYSGCPHLPNKKSHGKTVFFLQSSLPYHSSAILACALDCASLPYRQLTDSCSLSNVTENLTLLGKKVGDLCCKSRPKIFSKVDSDTENKFNVPSQVKKTFCCYI